MADLSLSCNNPPIGFVGVPYSHQFLAEGGTPPYFFFQGPGAPTGLGIVFDTGVISGTPTVKGIFSFLVLVVDSNFGFAQVQCSITIRRKCLVET